MYHIIVFRRVTPDSDGLPPVASWEPVNLTAASATDILQPAIHRPAPVWSVMVQSGSMEIKPSQFMLFSIIVSC